MTSFCDVDYECMCVVSQFIKDVVDFAEEELSDVGEEADELMQRVMSQQYLQTAYQW